MKNNIKKVSIKINEGLNFQIHDIYLDFTGRSEPGVTRGCSEGECYYVHQWAREDGKMDSYADCYNEAKRNGLNTHLQ